MPNRIHVHINIVTMAKDRSEQSFFDIFTEHTVYLQAPSYASVAIHTYPERTETMSW